MSNTPDLALVVQNGSERGKQILIEVGQSLVAGRGKDADIVVSDQRASRQHAKFSNVAGTLQVEDLNSKNGTYVNGEQVERRELFQGDVVEIRNLRIGIRPPASAESDFPMEHSGFGDSAVATMANALISPVGAGKLMAMLEFVLIQKKQGCVVLRASWDTGRVFLSQGKIYHASLEKSPDLRAEKALERLFRARSGMLEFNVGEVEKVPPQGLDHSIDPYQFSAPGFDQAFEKLLSRMKGETIRIIGSDKAIEDLSAQQKKIVKLAQDKSELASIMDRFSGSDLECIELLIDLTEAGLVESKNQ